ncbi:MAG TPA: response regulator transcription factor, partial [Ktedonobacterales bacterium]|nr:response regulator transcription factor [Ktedonobacterales bacterium]
HRPPPHPGPAHPAPGSARCGGPLPPRCPRPAYRENEEYLFQMLRAGASGYMLKEAADTDLISAIRVVSSGRFYLSPSAQSMMVSDYLQRVHTGEERDSYATLTDREREILKLVAEGYTNNQIAERLFISPKTVDTHRTHIMDKLNLHSRAELVKYAMRRGLLED